MFMDSHHPVFTQSTILLLFKNNVSETQFCLRYLVKPSQLGPIDRTSPYLRPQQGDVLDKNMIMEKVQKHSFCIMILFLS
jgi:hypothetical protein